MSSDICAVPPTKHRLTHDLFLRAAIHICHPINSPETIEAYGHVKITPRKTAQELLGYRRLGKGGSPHVDPRKR